MDIVQPTTNQIPALAPIGPTEGTSEQIASVTRQYWLNYSSILYEAYEKRFMTFHEVSNNVTVPMWSFKTAIFFAVTVVTTIGSF